MTRQQRIEARLRELRTQIAELRRQMEDITDAALGEARDLTAEEATAYGQHREARSAAKAEEARLDGELAELVADEARAAESAAAEERATEEAEQRQAEESRRIAGQAAQVRSEPLTYMAHDVRSSYLLDLARAGGQFGLDGQHEAQQRLQRHAAEMRVEAPRLERRRAGTTDNPTVRYADGEEDRRREERSGRSMAMDYERRDLDRTDGSGGEFVPPLWMMQEFIDLSRGGRIIADRCRQIPLPTGTDSIKLPRVASGSAVAMQTADNAAVQETDMTTDSVTGDVKTAAGQQDIALQALEQSPLAFDQIIFSDLMDDHAVTVDTQVINGSGAAGQVSGILQIPSVDTTTYTDASPTLPELWPKLADSANEVASNRLRRATAIFMHTRRWFWLLAQLDGQNRPFIVPSVGGPQNAPIAFGDADAEGPVGSAMGATIYADPNVPANLGGGTDEDRIIVTRPEDLYLFEGAVRSRVLPEIGSGTLTVRFQIYNYLAFIADRRPESTSVIAGTGLVAPTF